MELKLEGITKSYTKGKKRKNALEDFTLTLTEGVYGLLGPNGLRYKLKKLSSTSLR